MGLINRTITATFKNLTSIICRIDGEELNKVPVRGPLILIINHVNFLDAPLLYSHLQPRPITGFAKSETWDNPLLGALFTFYEAIPIHRGEPDITAFQKGWNALKEGKIVAISPEGTRSGNGRLLRAHAGMVTFAIHANAPLLPIAYYGAEKFHSNFRRLHRTDFHIRVGKQFLINPQGEDITREVRAKITDEIMYQVAKLLPIEYRGVYNKIEASTTNYLEFLNGNEIQ
jgi:1-acyl-sn-glycerol-3-phosphate acyltransferase